MKVSASIMACDFSDLKGELDKVRVADYIHVDIFDGHFAPNLTMGPDIVEAIHKLSKLPLHVHLQVTNPLLWIDRFAEYVDTIFFHPEIEEDVSLVIAAIRSFGKKVGLAIKPQTQIPEIKQYLRQIDYLLIMLIEPGFSHTEMIPEVLPKFSAMRKIVKDNDLKLKIVADGGMNMETVRKVHADIIVSGGYIFDAFKPADAIGNLRSQSTIEDFMEQ